MPSTPLLPEPLFHAYSITYEILNRAPVPFDQFMAYLEVSKADLRDQDHMTERMLIRYKGAYMAFRSSLPPEDRQGLSTEAEVDRYRLPQQRAPSTYVQDYGYFLHQEGKAHIPLTFNRVPLNHLSHVGSGIFTSMLNTNLHGAEFSVSFDFEYAVFDQLMDIALQQRRVDVVRAQVGLAIGKTLEFDKPFTVAITACVGRIEQNNREVYAPLQVIEVQSS